MDSPYPHLVRARVRSQVSGARALFVMRSIGDALLVAAEAVAPLVLAVRFGSIAGWSGAEAVMLLGLGRLGEGMALVVGRGLEPVTFGEQVRLGRFDQVLTRPVSPLGWLLTSEIDLRHVFRVVAGVGTVTWAAHHAGVAATPAHLATLAVAAIAAAIFILATLVMGAALTFRTIEGSDVANLAANGALGLASFPLDLYGGTLRFVFTFLLPMGLCLYVPVITVLDRDGPGVLGPGLLPFLPLVIGAYAALAALAWRRGLRRYRSTGS